MGCTVPVPGGTQASNSIPSHTAVSAYTAGSAPSGRHVPKVPVTTRQACLGHQRAGHRHQGWTRTQLSPGLFPEEAVHTHSSFLFLPSSWEEQTQ